MKKIKPLIMFVASLLGCGLPFLAAQIVVPATGGEAVGSGGAVSYTVGQAAYLTNTSIEHSKVQGVQQPYEISLITGIQTVEGLDIEFIVYPNPTSDWLHLKMSKLPKKQLRLQLYDLQGKLLVDKEMISKETLIPMSDLVPTIYFLKILDNHTAFNTYKIIKH